MSDATDRTYPLFDGMEVPAELASFKFARQKSKLAGTIRGSYFVISHKLNHEDRAAVTTSPAR
jgi:hypothetical protein